MATWKAEQARYAVPDKIEAPHLWATQDGQNCLACAQSAYRVIAAMAEAEADLSMAKGGTAENWWECMKDRMLHILCYWRTQIRQLDADCYGGTIDNPANEKKLLFPDAPRWVERPLHPAQPNEEVIF